MKSGYVVKIVHKGESDDSSYDPKHPDTNPIEIFVTQVG